MPSSTHHGVATALAAHSGADAFVLGYRLALNNKYPAQLGSLTMRSRCTTRYESVASCCSSEYVKAKSER